jgi:hypothetical protein
VADSAPKPSLFGWLSEPYGKPPWPTIDPLADLLGRSPTRFQVYAALRRMHEERVAKKGDLFVPGAITDGKGIYARQGLYQSESKALEKLQSFIDGWLASSQNAEADALTEALQDEWLRIAKLSPTPARGLR